LFPFGDVLYDLRPAIWEEIFYYPMINVNPPLSMLLVSICMLSYDCYRNLFFCWLFFTATLLLLAVAPLEPRLRGGCGKCHALIADKGYERLTSVIFNFDLDQFISATRRTNAICDDYNCELTLPLPPELTTIVMDYAYPDIAPTKYESWRSFLIEPREKIIRPSICNIAKTPAWYFTGEGYSKCRVPWSKWFPFTFNSALYGWMQAHGPWFVKFLREWDEFAPGVPIEFSLPLYCAVYCCLGKWQCPGSAVTSILTHAHSSEFCQHTTPAFQFHLTAAVEAPRGEPYYPYSLCDNRHRGAPWVRIHFVSTFGLFSGLIFIGVADNSLVIEVREKPMECLPDIVGDFSCARPFCPCDNRIFSNWEDTPYENNLHWSPPHQFARVVDANYGDDFKVYVAERHCSTSVWYDQIPQTLTNTLFQRTDKIDSTNEYEACSPCDCAYEYHELPDGDDRYYSLTQGPIFHSCYDPNLRMSYSEDQLESVTICECIDDRCEHWKLTRDHTSA
jgi:hypothetical protein